jgi:hypothetical protein
MFLPCRLTMPLAFSLVLAATLAAPLAAEDAPAPAARAGITFHRTSNAQYNYYVCVPKAYADDKPAGIHLFFHGESAGRGARIFDVWQETLLEPHNLIGINMQFPDGQGEELDGDFPAKAKAAMEALKQVVKDFRVIPGRGVVASHGIGGRPHALLLQAAGRTPIANHSALYGSSFPGDPAASPHMSWTMTVGTGVWTMRHYNPGPDLMRTADRLFAGALRGGCPDVLFRVDKGRGHAYDRRDAEDCAEQFARTDLALAPFIYEPAYTEAAAQKIVRMANGHDLAKALDLAAQVAEDAAASAEAKTQAADLKAKIEARADAAVAMVKGLVDKDPALAAYYAALMAKQLAGTERAVAMQGVADGLRRDAKAKDATAAQREFFAAFKTLVRNKELREGAAPALAAITQRAGAESLVGRMAFGFGQLADGF